MIKRNIIILFLLLFCLISLSYCLHREYTTELDPALPYGKYYIRYYEECGMYANCSKQLDEIDIKKYDNYFITYENTNLLIILANHYRYQELFRKYFYYYDELFNNVKTEYTDSNNNILSYNLYSYDEKNNLIKENEYLKDGEEDVLYKETKYVYDDYSRLSIIDTKDYSNSEFVRRQYVVYNYNSEGDIIAQTDYDTYYLVFKPSIGDITKDFLKRYFMKNPKILEYDLIIDGENYSSYTILHIETDPKEIAQKLLVALNFVGDIRDTNDVKFDKNIITFIR